MLTYVAPWAQQVRFVKTGSEATHAAYRIAKRATGREVVLMGDWAYHGWHEWCSTTPDGVPESPFTVRFPHGAYLPAWLDSQNIEWSQIAAVFIEPHRWQPTDRNWLQDVKRECWANGTLLVFDEMIYGGRWALGGASEFFGVTPDLACYGKALGNGAPIACVVGSRDLIGTHGEMVSGTYSGETVGLEALIEVVEFYRTHDVIGHLWQRGAQLVDGLKQACAQYPSLGAVVEGAAPVHVRLRFADPALGLAFSAQMVQRDVLWHPDCVNVSYAHTRAIIETVVQAAADSLAALERESV